MYQKLQMLFLEVYCLLNETESIKMDIHKDGVTNRNI